MALLLFFCRQGMLFKHHPHKASERELELSHKRSRSQNGMTPRSLKWLIVTSGHDKCSGWRLLCLRGISTIGRRGRHGFDLELSRLRLQKNRNYKYLAIFDPLITNRLLIAKGIGK